MIIITVSSESVREQQHNKPKIRRFDKMLEYIHLNPVMAGFVIKPAWASLS